MKNKSNTPGSAEPQEAQTPDEMPLVSPEYKTTLESLNEATGIVVLDTSAPDGTEVEAELNFKKKSGKVQNGKVWLAFPTPVEKPILLTLNGKPLN